MRKSVLTPQMREAASANSALVVRYAPMTPRAVLTSAMSDLLGVGR
jgi:hypothetical protein